MKTTMSKLDEEIAAMRKEYAGDVPVVLTIENWMLKAARATLVDCRNDLDVDNSTSS